jgi:hypothetical protein
MRVGRLRAPSTPVKRGGILVDDHRNFDRLCLPKVRFFLDAFDVNAIFTCQNFCGGPLVMNYNALAPGEGREFSVIGEQMSAS